MSMYPFPGPLPIHLMEGDDRKIPLGVSKLGGGPDLPPTFEWPYDGEKPLSFICQIRLDELARSDAAPFLPKAGMLYFFAEKESWGVNASERASWRVAFLRDVSYIERGTEADDIFGSCRMSFADGTSNQEAADSIRAQVFGDQVFGYQLTNVRVECQRSHDNLPYEDTCTPEAFNALAENLPKEALEWLFLLQIDDGVSAYFFMIRKDHLRSESFDDVLFMLETS